MWALLGGKTEELYDNFFDAISKKCQEKLQFRLMPEAIITDYEIGVAAAVRKNFEISEHWGCFFHYSQCSFQKIQEVGLFRQYQENEIMQKIARMLFALAFLPKQEIKEAFTKYEQEERHLNLEPYPQLGKTFDYVKNFWIFGPYPMKMWNVFDRPKNLRTTNKCENWNILWNQDAGTSKTMFWNIVQKLSDQEQKSKIEIRRFSGGEPPLPQKKDTKI